MNDPSKTPAGRDESDARRAREADSILRRVAEETDPQIGAAAGRLITRTGRHLAGEDADQNDRIEVIGTRIGRGLALAVFLVLAISLATNLLGG